MNQAKHHYVPEWYQFRFLPPNSSDNRLWYLDTLPQPIPHQGGHHYDRNPQRWGRDLSFHEHGMYCLHFGKAVTDAMERVYFGTIDNLGGPAVAAMADYVVGETPGKYAEHLVLYLDAQKMRTPKGIAHLKALAKTDDHESALHLMRALSQIHSTIWYEGVWEVFRLENTTTKLLLTDHPVTCYNRHFGPGGENCSYPIEPEIDLIGTQTLFPLRRDRLLVISNLQFVRDRSANGTLRRSNARRWGNTMKFLGGIHTGRQLTEEEVIAVNYILKRMATRYIAAAEKEWLYPERVVSTKRWRELGGEFFLRPDPRRMGFAGEMYVQYADGSVFAIDEYGRLPDNNPERVAQREAERQAWLDTMAYWDEKLGPLPPGMMVE